MIIIECHFPTHKCSCMRSSEPKYNTLLLFLNLAVAFFSVSYCSRGKVYKLAALHEAGS